MKKGLFCLIGDFIGRNEYSLNDDSITIDEDYFLFPTNASLNHLISVRVLNESTYDDVTFSFNLTLQNVQSDSRIGILLKSATDGYDGEKASFVIGDGKISFYYDNVKQIDFVDFDITTLENGPVDLKMRRWNDYYYFIFKNQTHVFRFKGDGSVFRQNVNACVYGSSVGVKINRVYYTTDTPNIKFGLLGDSVGNGYSSGGGGWEDTIKGINLLENNISIGEFAGSANIIKDQLDGFSELGIIKPKYAIIMYGHNDVLFDTGRLTTDYIKMVQNVQNYGIIPIICTIPYSAWIDTTIVNDFITANYFNDKYLHLDLRTVLSPPAPGPDYNDIAHPSVQGNRKLATAIYNYIKNLP